jgi:ornithine cyclodeaminase
VKVLILSQQDVEKLLPMADCMDCVQQALVGLSRGEGQQPLRQILWLPDRSGALGLMPGSLEQPAVIGLKAISVFPGNRNTPYDSHQGTVMLFEREHGRLLCLLDATSLTAIRTAAASGVATKCLAREDAGDLAILGCGVQALTHLQAMAAARTIRRVRCAGRDRAQAQAFVDRAAASFSGPLEACATAEEAVTGADLICTVTSASEPVLSGSWLSPGCHINAVGACRPKSRELDGTAVSRSSVFVDRRESADHEAGDLLLARAEGSISEDFPIVELGDVLAGTAAGRQDQREITLFKSLGIAVEDLASAAFVYERAQEQGLGTAVELGGERHGSG